MVEKKIAIIASLREKGWDVRFVLSAIYVNNIGSMQRGVEEHAVLVKYRHALVTDRLVRSLVLDFG